MLNIRLNAKYLRHVGSPSEVVTGIHRLKIKFIRMIRCLLIAYCPVANYSYLEAQSFNFCRTEAGHLVKLIDNYHVTPPPVDDVFSQRVFKAFILQLDPNRIYFTAEDIRALSVYQYQIDNELRGESWNFLRDVETIFKKRLTQTDNLFQSLLNNPLNLAEKDFIVFPKTDTLLYYDQGKSYESWIKKWLKHQVLYKMFTPLWHEDSVINYLFDEHSEIEARNLVLQKEIRKINRILNYPEGTESLLSVTFLKCIALCTDPHTMYMSSDEKIQFDKALSSEGFSFGFSLDENERGEIEIIRIVPGSPVWKTNSIHKGDIILKAAWKSARSIDFSGISMSEVNDFFLLPGNKMEITIKKANGSIKTIEISREKIVQEDNIVRGFLLDGSIKAGYIVLPGFYSDFNNENGLGCANDVAKEILKLQKEGIVGLILDVRFNGGGSVKEALDLTGIFIDFGPVCFSKEKPGNPVILKDLNRGTIYNGPLIVLVNGQSASASEITAAALQDYNRAIIAGSRTYGKATGQIIVPCDTTFNLYKSNHAGRKPKSGYIKLTSTEIYRINSKTFQKRGVQPDIFIPDAMVFNSVSEENTPFALQHDSISKKATYIPYPEIPVAQLKLQSSNRIASHPVFQQLNSYNDSIIKQLYLTEQSVSLNKETYLEKVKKSFELLQKTENIHQFNRKIFTVSTPAFDKRLLALYPEFKDYYNEQFIKITRDFQIQETYQILNDYINQINISK